MMVDAHARTSRRSIVSAMRGSRVSEPKQRVDIQSTIPSRGNGPGSACMCFDAIPALLAAFALQGIQSANMDGSNSTLLLRNKERTDLCLAGASSISR